MSRAASSILPKKLLSEIRHEQPHGSVSNILVDVAKLDTAAVLVKLTTSVKGLSGDEALARRSQFGPNVLDKDQRKGLGTLFWRAFANPLVILLAVLATISFATADPRAGLMMALMIALGVGLELIQQAKAETAAAKLKSMISVTATAIRDGTACEIAVSELVPGDVVELAAGDMIPADVRILSAKDLFVAQGSLTGESYPIEKFEVEKNGTATTPMELSCIGFLGTSVESGSATAVVITTGKETYLGGIAHSIAEEQPPTAFDKGIRQFTWLMLRFILVMVPLVFVINGLTKGNWLEAFFFAVAVAVGLTPEMLPMVVTVCLSNGAIAMSRKKVIVKRINAIQNLGAMDVLCTDKTGTLTMDQVTLERHCDVALKEDDAVQALAYLNSHFQTGLKNILDRAILAHSETHAAASILKYSKVDEIPFDFQRRIMSVVVRTPEGGDRIISKGAPEAIFARCESFELDGALLPMDHAHIEALKKEYEQLSADGFRVLAIAIKDVPQRGVAGATPLPILLRTSPG